jgi:flagellar basal-body rod modification protein FlgD
MTINPLTQTAAATATSSTAAATAAAANNAESSFMQMLVTELQSQDPTSPMDPTQMVGQMLSMNQLNELIAINATLENAFPNSGSATGSSTTSTSSTPSPANLSTGAH